jgi:hypothetical protein
VFSFYFAQCGTGLTLFFAFLLLHNPPMAGIMTTLTVPVLVLMILTGFGLMTCMSIDPQRPRYMLTCVPAFGLFYLSVHVALGGPPEPKLFAGMVAAALAHLLAVWLLWHRSEPAMEIASDCC